MSWEASDHSLEYPSIYSIIHNIYLEPNICQVQQLYTLQYYPGLGKFNPILY